MDRIFYKLWLINSPWIRNVEHYITFLIGRNAWPCTVNCLEKPRSTQDHSFGMIHWFWTCESNMLLITFIVSLGRYDIAMLGDLEVGSTFDLEWSCELQFGKFWHHEIATCHHTSLEMESMALATWQSHKGQAGCGKASTHHPICWASPRVCLYCDRLWSHKIRWQKTGKPKCCWEGWLGLINNLYFGSVCALSM